MIVLYSIVKVEYCKFPVFLQQFVTVCDQHTFPLVLKNIRSQQHSILPSPL